MGNFIFCGLSTTKAGKRTIRVIFSSGEIRQFYDPIKAAEIMFETPNFFLMNSKSLHIGRKFSPLVADEDLKFGNLYVMFPMKRVNSIVTATDLSPLFLAAKSTSKSHRRMANSTIKALLEAEKIFKEVLAVQPPQPVVNLEVVEDLFTSEFKRRLSISRSKKPLLETIIEEPISSR